MLTGEIGHQGSKVLDVLAFKRSNVLAFRSSQFSVLSCESLLRPPPAAGAVAAHLAAALSLRAAAAVRAHAAAVAARAAGHVAAARAISLELLPSAAGTTSRAAWTETVRG